MDRQTLVKDLVVPITATVVGLGGTGFWTAYFLAMSGVENLILVDDDEVEESNRNRLPLRSGDVGRKKIEALNSYLSDRCRNEPRVEIHISKIEKEADCAVLRGAVFCCTDTLKSQQLVCAYCRKNKLKYQRIGYDGTVLNVSTGFPLTFEKVDEQTGYTVTPSWIAPAVAAAALGVSSALYKNICIMDDIGTLCIKESSHIPVKVKDNLRELGKNDGIDSVTNDPDAYNLGHCDDCNDGFDNGVDYVCENPDNYNLGNCETCEEREAGVKEGYDDGYDEGKEYVENNLNEFNLVEKEDYDELKNKVAELEKELEFKKAVIIVLEARLECAGISHSEKKGERDEQKKVEKLETKEKK